MKKYYKPLLVVLLIGIILNMLIDNELLNVVVKIGMVWFVLGELLNGRKK